MSSESVVVERVARSPDELAFLTRIVEQPTNDLNRLVYADWLEERGDPRGPFLRSFVETFQTGQPLPPLSDIPTAWADLVGLTITEAFVKSGLAELRDNLLVLARPALRIEVSEANFENPPSTPTELGTTRLGGDPDLPTGAEFPVAADGVPLHFLGQYDLADIQGTLAGLAFPTSGLLSLFRTQSDGKNCYPTQEDLPLLIRRVPAGTPLARLPRPTDLTDPPAPFRPGLRLVETLRLPGEYREWPGVTLTSNQASQIDEDFPTNLGGTAYILLGHVTHGNIGEEPLKDRPDWVQLILVPFFEGPDYGISDMSLSYQLPAADLKAGRFDRLEATFG